MHRERLSVSIEGRGQACRVCFGVACLVGAGVQSITVIGSSAQSSAWALLKKRAQSSLKVTGPFLGPRSAEPAGSVALLANQLASNRKRLASPI